ncbi:MAG: hypothetical protein ACRC4W_01975 [Treponemataceae bacterium]
MLGAYGGFNFNSISLDNQFLGLIISVQNKTLVDINLNFEFSRLGFFMPGVSVDWIFYKTPHDIAFAVGSGITVLASFLEYTQFNAAAAGIRIPIVFTYENLSYIQVSPTAGVRLSALGGTALYFCIPVTIGFRIPLQSCVPD